MISMGLVHTATVYTPNGTDGDYTVVDNAALACRLVVVGGLETAPERDEGARRRPLLWGTAYSMPTDAQLAIGGVRWNVMPETIEEVSGLGGTAVYRRCMVVQA